MMTVKLDRKCIMTPRKINHPPFLLPHGGNFHPHPLSQQDHPHVSQNLHKMYMKWSQNRNLYGLRHPLRNQGRVYMRWSQRFLTNPPKHRPSCQGDPQYPPLRRKHMKFKTMMSKKIMMNFPWQKRKFHRLVCFDRQ
ncbi:uncharacterized protein LOC134255052 isoform X1 [Saccostrea cucullata]|uniref:uncharacterized protein LOC134255052 isoform X1 n=1 Tax=Saccostrea cuccullata TaxID=36930 RepID=UPI002ED039E5